MKIIIFICDATFIRYFDRIIRKILSDDSKELLLLTRTREWMELLQEKYPEAMVGIGYHPDIIDRFTPDILLAGQIWWWDIEPVLKHARNLNIPILHFEHGALLSISAYILEKEENYLDYRSNLALCSHVAVWGDRPKEVWVSYGVSHEKFLITGAPHLDYLYELKSRPKINVYEKLGIAKKKILFVYTVVTGQNEKFDRYCLDLLPHIEHFVANHPEYQLVIKPHPSEMLWYDRMKYQTAPETIVIAHHTEDCRWENVKRVDVDEIVYNSDVVIGMSSSSMFTPIILNVPFIHFEMDDCLSHDVASFGKKCHYNISDPSGIGQVILEAVGNVDYDSSDMARHLNYNNDGRATKRIVNAIEQIVAEKRKGRFFYTTIEEEFLENIRRYPFLPYPVKSLIEYYIKEDNMAEAEKWLAEYCRKFNDPTPLLRKMALHCYENKNDKPTTLKYLVLYNKYQPLPPELMHIYKQSLFESEIRSIYAI